jgi:hypothetical protein
MMKPMGKIQLDKWKALRDDAENEIANCPETDSDYLEVAVYYERVMSACERVVRFARKKGMIKHMPISPMCVSSNRLKRMIDYELLNSEISENVALLFKRITGL